MSARSSEPAHAPVGVIFAGGGTGGHLYPGFAIAERLRELRPDVRTLFICSDKPLDARLLSEQSLDFIPIPARPLALSLRGLARLAASWGACVRASRAAIRSMRERGLDVRLAAMGGYVAAPVAQAARAERVPITLVNLDAHPGKANRWIARHAARRLTAAPVDAAAFPSWERTAPIVRRAARSEKPPAECRRVLGLAPDLPTLFVTGASQGAKSINDLLVALVLRPDRAGLRGWQVYHQTGDVGEQLAHIERAYNDAGVRAIVTPYCRDMASAWGAADLAISRAGAGSVGEAWANATPTVFLPYPHHRDQHQRANARPLVDAGGAILEIDHIDSARNADEAGSRISDLLADAGARARMRRATLALGPADGAEHAARAILGLP